MNMVGINKVTIAKPVRANIKNKNPATIIPIIKNVILPGSIIHQDEAKLYNIYEISWKDSTYQHPSLIHKYSFLNYESGIFGIIK